MKKSIITLTSIAVIVFVLATFIWFIPSLKSDNNPTEATKKGASIEGESGKIAQRDPSGNPVTATPTEEAVPSDSPTPVPNDSPTPVPSDSPTPSGEPSPTGVGELTPTGGQAPTQAPTNVPTNAPTNSPTLSPTNVPTKAPNTPTNAPTKEPTKAATPTQAPTDTPSPKPTPTTAPTNTPSPTPEPTKEPTKVPTLTPTPVTDLADLRVNVHSDQYTNKYAAVSFQGTGEFYGFVSMIGRQPGDNAVYKMDKSVAVSNAKKMLKQLFNADGNTYSSMFFASGGVTLGSQPFQYTGGKHTTFGNYVSSVKNLYKSQYIDSEILVIADTNCVYFEEAAIEDMVILVPVVRCRIIYDVRINNAGSLYGTTGLFKGLSNGSERYYQFVDVCPVCMTDGTGAFGSGIVALTEPRLFR